MTRGGRAERAALAESVCVSPPFGRPDLAARLGRGVLEFGRQSESDDVALDAVAAVRLAIGEMIGRSVRRASMATINPTAAVQARCARTEEDTLSRMRTRIAAALITMSAVLATVSTGTAGATTGAPDCRDGWTLYETYKQNGYDATADALYANLISMGCHDSYGDDRCSAAPRE